MVNIEETPRLFYKLNELVKIWEKYGKSETDILHMAALGKATLHIWYNGTIMLKNFLKENIKSSEKNDYSLEPYDDLARLPIEEAKKFALKESDHIRYLIDKAGNSFIAYWSERELGEYHRSELCMVPEEVKRLTQEFSQLQKEQSVGQMPEPDIIITENREKRGGAPKSSLRIIVEYAYNKLMSNSNIEPIMRGNIEKFMSELAKMKKSAVITSECSAFDNIKDIKKSLGKWVIRTEDQILKDTDKREIVEKAKTYKANDISKLLSELRKIKPLPQ